MVSDEQFLDQLRDFLMQAGAGSQPAIPYFYAEDGSVDRQKTLALPCYELFVPDK